MAFVRNSYEMSKFVRFVPFVRWFFPLTLEMTPQVDSGTNFNSLHWKGFLQMSVHMHVVGPRKELNSYQNGTNFFCDFNGRYSRSFGTVQCWLFPYTGTWWLYFLSEWKMEFCNRAICGNFEGLYLSTFEVILTLLIGLIRLPMPSP